MVLQGDGRISAMCIDQSLISVAKENHTGKEIDSLGVRLGNKQRSLVKVFF